MTVTRMGIIALVIGFAGLCLQLAVAPKLVLLGASPDLLLVPLLVFCPVLSRSRASLMGFFFGASYGACIGASVWQYVSMYCLTGFFVAWLIDTRIATTPPVLLAIGFFGTVLARLILMFLTGPSGIGSYLGDTILSAVYNGVLVLSLYAVLKRFVDPAFR